MYYRNFINFLEVNNIKINIEDITLLENYYVKDYIKLCTQSVDNNNIADIYLCFYVIFTNYQYFTEKTICLLYNSFIEMEHYQTATYLYNPELHKAIKNLFNYNSDLINVKEHVAIANARKLINSVF